MVARSFPFDTSAAAEILITRDGFRLKSVKSCSGHVESYQELVQSSEQWGHELWKLLR